MASSTLLVLNSLLLLLLLPTASAAINCGVQKHSSLSSLDTNSFWASPSGEFAFGFRELPGKNGSLFLLSIWFNKIPDETIVWSANGNNPAPKGSSVNLTETGELVLFDPQGAELWNATTNGVAVAAATCAAMLDVGNFVLLNGDSDPIWQSFKLPTDTILPGQIFDTPTNLSSRESPASYADGRFLLSLQGDGNLVLYPLSRPSLHKFAAYWSSGTVGGNSTLIFDEAGYIYIKEGTQKIYNLTRKNLGGSKEDFYQLARIGHDGVFRQYYHPRKAGCDNLTWEVLQSIPEDICLAITGDLGSGACGYNSYCAVTNSEPNCFCPEGYSFLDQSNKYKGCKPDFPLPSCQANGWEARHELIEFKELLNTNWPLTDYDLQVGSGVDEETCKQLCREDCFCATIIFDGKESCWKKKHPLSNGRKDASVAGKALIKVPKVNVTHMLLNENCPSKKDQSTVILIISVLLGSSAFINLLLILAISLAIFFLYRQKQLNLSSVSSMTSSSVRSYTYKELEEATGGFKQKLGKGAFGTVYKGVLKSDPGRFLAVKKLDKVVQEGEKEFKTEVNAIGQTHHRNLVRLFGYCDEGENRLLVYEYMSNGSLASLLFGISRPDWNQRVQIALGIARGLMYLHEECSNQIIHCDIKPQNILMDEYLVPRISDFGLAKLLLVDQTRVTRTGVRGTIGYFAPEWFRRGSITVKVDVYGFGVMLIEIICCKSSVAFAVGCNQEEALIDWAYHCYTQRKMEKMVENDEEARNDLK
ncbi:G-type lectin S-receptor-like serine/threonine-protein kinase LECRK2 [Tripterygium wilfordii]|uniref:G-type lectin S-receptor-like serine/threonine-protein kinase LECRK2 n=1 Tax=Tripterygium wilfordii TaxID=458696 RepID=UPI0018F83A34|nr:G-type lectin S-receptor-like serine/threonine-protein kinase LECRK2 [Tripterygium wilfordii]